ncbi:MAG: alpha/beta fold hydrolase [Myxococcales bacterium]|nr:MAG: alpha/beta fold hydrolase [Myxococcales bacterium]
MSTSFEIQRLTIHGHERAFVKAGEGPVLLLLHGLACDHTTWSAVIEKLARRYTVIAPDLLGHGESAKPRADYSLGGYANGMRDLLTVLGIDKVTVVGHSFGGGVAMQFAYQFPERTQRMILVAPGGMGPEVTPLIRALTLPGAHQVLGLATLPGIRQIGKAALRLLHRSGSIHARDLVEVADIYESMKDPAARKAIRHLTRAVVDTRGQIVTMVDRAYLTQAMPMLVIWGRQDMVLPSKQADNVELIAPGAVVEVMDNCGHFPQKDHPERFVKVVDAFIRNTEAATYHRGRWRTLLKNGHQQPIDLEAPAAEIRQLAASR